MIQAGLVLERFRTLPVEPRAPGRFIVLAPHPDDESLGCGGMIAGACAAGAPPEVVILTDGAASHPESVRTPPPVLAQVRRDEVTRAMAALGLPAWHLHFLNLPDGAAPSAGPEADWAVDRIVSLAAGCDAIMTSWRHDPHPDHQAAWAVAQRAAWRLGITLWEYPVWGWTLPPGAPLPDETWLGQRVDVSPYLGAKRQAVQAHASQLGKVVTDAPNGFVLEQPFLALFDGPFETLVRTP
jgi:LmbE family N-acetylglucosaminyl deacetylase